MQLTSSGRRANERRQPPDESSPVSGAIPRLRRASTCYVVALVVRHWRCGAGCVGVDRSTPRRWPKLGAGAAVGPDRVRELSVSIHVVFRRQRTLDQPGLANRGWVITGKRLAGTPVLRN